MSALFPPEFLRQLDGLHLLARQIARGRLRAERRSVRHGSGMEFADYRAFTPGDDIRGVDWKVFARNRHLLLKLFEEEEDLHVHLVLDTSHSMAWGEPPKFDAARRIVAGLAYLALANLDRAGIAPLGPDAPSLLPAGRGRARFLRILRYLEACSTHPGEWALGPAMKAWLATRPRRGLVVWVTDAWGVSLNDAFDALDRLRYARHEIGLVHVRHADEAEAGELGEFACEDVESGATRSLVIDRAVAVEYRNAVADYEARLTEYCRRHGIAHLSADAAAPTIEILRRALLEGGFAR